MSLSVTGSFGPYQRHVSSILAAIGESSEMASERPSSAVVSAVELFVLIDWLEPAHGITPRRFE